MRFRFPPPLAVVLVFFGRGTFALRLKERQSRTPKCDYADGQWQRSNATTIRMPIYDFVQWRLATIPLLKSSHAAKATNGFEYPGVGVAIRKNTRSIRSSATRLPTKYFLWEIRWP